MISKASAVVACLTLTALTTYAQAPQAGRGGQRQGGPAAAQPANAKAIETMMDNLGMLRGMQRNDSVNRIEMWGENGTKVIGGKPVTLTNWKVSLNFTMNGMRFDYTHDGQRTIEVVSDKYAWNEDMPGGKATPMPATLQERQIQMMLTPIGMAKAAKAAGDAAKVSTTGGVTTLTFPASFVLVAASNPCPCGFANDFRRECFCTPPQIQRYMSKISGPLMDRIDIQIDVPAVPYKELRGKSDGQSSATIRERVEAAREIQRQRGF